MARIEEHSAHLHVWVGVFQCEDCEWWHVCWYLGLDSERVTVPIAFAFADQGEAQHAADTIATLIHSIVSRVVEVVNAIEAGRN